MDTLKTTFSYDTFVEQYCFGDNWGDMDAILAKVPHVYNAATNYPGGGVPLHSTPDYQNIDTGTGHYLIIGGTGSGKTESCVKQTICNCARAGESILVIDPKGGELYESVYSELLRQNYDNIILINCRDTKRGSRYNPLLLPAQMIRAESVDDRDLGMRMLRNLCNAIFVIPGISEKDPFWDYSASEMFFGLALALIEKASCLDEITLSNVVTMLIEGKERIGNTTLLDEFYKTFFTKNSIAYKAISTRIMVPSDTAKSMDAVFFQKMMPYISSEAMLNMTSTSDIDMEKVADGKTAFFILVPDESQIFHPMISVIIFQLYEQLVRLAHMRFKGKLPIRFNLILEEFGNLKIHGASSFFSAALSRNIRIVAVVQNLQQLENNYGPANAATIKYNCNNWIYLHTRDCDTLRTLSELLGSRNVLIGGKFVTMPLTTIAELQTLEMGQALVLFEREKPFVTKLEQFSNCNYAIPEFAASYPFNRPIDKKFFNMQEILKAEMLNSMCSHPVQTSVLFPSSS